MKSRERALAAATASVLVVALGWTQALAPGLERWRAKGEEVEALEERRRSMEELLGRGGAILEDRHALDLALAPAEAPHEAISTFLDRVRAFSEAAGFRPTTVRFIRADRYEGAFAELRFELRASAPLKQLQDFLVRLAGGAQYMRVQSLSVIPARDGNLDAEFALVALAPIEAAEEGRR